MKDTNGTAEKRPAEESSSTNKKRRILEKIHYEDLEDSNKSEDFQELKLSKVRFERIHNYNKTLSTIS